MKFQNMLYSCLKYFKAICNAYKDMVSGLTNESNYRCAKTIESIKQRGKYNFNSKIPINV